MRAWTAVGAGAPKDVLKFRHDWHMPPKTKSGEIMVRVSYVALNPGDVKMMAHKVPFKGTTIPAMDLVGEIVQIGPSITSTPASLKIGMTVAGTTSMTNVWRGIGTLAEYVVLPATMVVEKPEGLDESIAAGLLGVAGQTSYVLTDTAGLHEGDRALINGASGGVGCILTQALRGMGVSVTAVCSSKNAAMVRRLGAEEVSHIINPLLWLVIESV
jgi:NADPH:quinone reductase-like Zn-dependent oxidoreductase